MIERAIVVTRGSMIDRDATSSREWTKRLTA
jgi:hypothetical protein